ncbi:MAG: hypothetical protein RLZZ299_726 [Pseudomonadota bacterium]|jgi:hypothetical protein
MPVLGYNNHFSGVSYKHEAALTTTKQVFALTADTVNCPFSVPVPNDCALKQLNFELDTIAGGASSVTYFLARDLAGDIPVTPEASASVTFGFTTATKGTAIACIDLEHHYQELGSEVRGTLYIVVKVNAGTANANIRLYWQA